MKDKFKAGDWLRGLNHGFYKMVVKILEDDKILLREPGAYREDGYVGTKSIVEINYELATLVPDFSDATVNDKAFSYRMGEVKISHVDKEQRKIKVGNCLFNLDGKNDDHDKHPTLFHGYAQAKAYFDEMYEEMEKEYQAKTEQVASDADEPCEYCAEHGTMVCPDCITQDEQDSIR